jgi:hypothetical protein
MSRGRAPPLARRVADDSLTAQDQRRSSGLPCEPPLPLRVDASASMITPHTPARDEREASGGYAIGSLASVENQHSPVHFVRGGVGGGADWFVAEGVALVRVSVAVVKRHARRAALSAGCGCRFCLHQERGGRCARHGVAPVARLTGATGSDAAVERAPSACSAGTRGPAGPHDWPRSRWRRSRSAARARGVPGVRFFSCASSNHRGGFSSRSSCRPGR